MTVVFVAGEIAGFYLLVKTRLIVSFIIEIAAVFL